MDTLNEFLQIAKEQNYQTDVYPYSEKGPVRINKIISSIWGILFSVASIVVLSLVIHFATSYQQSKTSEAEGQAVVQTVPESTSEEVVVVKEGSGPVRKKTGSTTLGLEEINIDGSPPLTRIVQTMESYGIPMSAVQEFFENLGINLAKVGRTGFTFAIGFFVVRIIFLWILYSFDVVRRWRKYERDVFRNDVEAALLKRKILRSIDFNKQYKAARRARNAQKEFDPKKDGRVEALLAFKNMKLNINTRQSLDGYNIIKSSRIIFEVPFNEFALEDLENQIKNINNIATRKTKAISKFGTIETSEDRQHWTVRAQSVVPDKYLFDTGEVEVDTNEYHSTFALSMFVDRSDQIAAIKDKTELFARRTSETMAMLLTSAKYQVKFVSYTISASTVTYIYEWTFDTQAPNVQSLSKTIDKNFGVTGSEVLLMGDKLQITMPLDSQYQIPIDVATMYRGAFGGDEK